MKKSLILIFLCFFVLQVKAENSTQKSIYSVSQLVSSEKGRELIVQDDDFSRSLSKFDLEVRVHNAEPTLENLNKFTQEQVLEWSDTEKEELDSLIKVISDIAIQKEFHFILPDNIDFIKTTMEANKGAGGYTRLNYIVLSQDVLLMSKEQLKSIIAHEIFHIISRYNPELREKFYSLIGFTVCNPIKITTDLKNYTIANPDAPNIDAYITLKDSLNNDVYCAMVLYSNRDYTTGTLFEYLDVGLLKLVKSDNGTMTPFTENGEVKLYTLREVSNFIEQIGLNTQYVINPEEIIASNFELLFQANPTVRTPQLLQNIDNALKGNK